MARQAFQCYYDKGKDLYRKRLKDINGKYISLYDRDKAALKKKYERAKREIETNLQIGENITVAEYSVKWFALNTAELSYARKNDYKVAINNYIAPKIGNSRLRDVKADDVKEIISGMDGMSRSAQSNVVIALKRIFASAEANKLILQTPCTTLKAGGYKHKEKVPLTNKQAQMLIEAVKDTSAFPFIMIGLYAGLRREEILGLQWDCIFLDKMPHISVRRSLTFINNCRPIVSEKLKSNAAKRDIPIPPQLTECLKTLKEKSSSNFVMANTKGQEYTYTSFRNMWQIIKCRQVEREKDIGSSPNNHPQVKRNIDFAVTPHILRHTYITNLILSGMNIKKVQYLAGHSTVEMTLNIYTHVIENRPEDFMEDIINAFSG